MRTLILVAITLIFVVIAVSGIFYFFSGSYKGLGAPIDKDKYRFPTDYATVGGTVLSYKQPGAGTVDATFRIDKIIDYKRHENATWPELKEGEVVVRLHVIEHIKRKNATEKCSSNPAAYQDDDGTTSIQCAVAGSIVNPFDAEETEQYLAGIRDTPIILNISTSGQGVWYTFISLEKEI